MSQFKIEIIAVGPSGCDRKAQSGDKLHNRCGKFGCPDCMAYDFVQQLRQKGMGISSATFTNNHGRPDAEVEDDLFRNERKGGQF